jgi:hypothetical protein
VSVPDLRLDLCSDTSGLSLSASARTVCSRRQTLACPDFAALTGVNHHRTHDVANLFLCDGSSFVTSGRGQPTLTIEALAFRAAEHIGRFARRNEI